MDATSTAKYSTFTVPQLKALCKEKKLSGYSKLGKAALVEKLTTHDLETSTTAAALSSSSGSAAFLPPVLPTSSSSAKAAQRTNNALNQISLRSDEGLFGPFGNTVPQPPVGFSVDDQNLEQLRIGQTTSSVILTREPTDESTEPCVRKEDREVLKRGREGTEVTSENAIKRSRMGSAETNLRPSQQLTAQKLPGLERQQDISRLGNQLSKLPLEVEGRAPNVSKARLSSNAQTLKETRARFKPLCAANGRKSTTLTGDSLNPVHTPTEFQDGRYHLESLPERHRISISSPGLLKESQKWAIILSGIGTDERIVCCHVSKTIRYAIYLSAVDILSRDFCGRRSAKLMQQHPPTTTNFWPYLRARQREREMQFKLYQDSLLPVFFGDRIPIAAHLWASPEYENQSSIAMRFLLTRVWFSISVLGDRDGCSRLFVTDARQVIKDEVWCVDVATLDDDGRESYKESFYVLEETCEVIGRPAPTGTEDSAHHLQGIRVDWSDYIQLRLLPSGFHSSPPKPLRSHLKWTNAEEYDMGISKLWLRRIEKEGALGQYKRKIAERYILACVVSNSVSGEWMSASRMQQEFAGGVTVQDHTVQKRDKLRVNLFLPSHHLVESVHLLSACGKDLHKDLAVVQTPNREYYILRDNGMEVGCEEDGVWDVWRNLLSCDGRGLAN